jgi:hypothetical protein
MALKFPKAYLDSLDRKKTSASPIPTKGTDSARDKAVIATEVEFQAQGVGEGKSVTDMDASSIVSLDFQTWLPFAAKTYHISPDPHDYFIKPMIMMPTDIPNRNGISFPLAELVKFQPPPMNRQVYKSWVGTPIHIEHASEDCTTAIGVVIDTALRKIKGYGNDAHWKVFGLLAIDKTKDPAMAQKLISGEINTGSMGTMANSFTCSVCGAPATKNRFTNCSHIVSTEAVNWNPVTFMGKEHIAHLNAHDLSPIEYSIVEAPAWSPALSDLSLNWGGD